jgi:hypothetical protein
MQKIIANEYTILLLLTYDRCCSKLLPAMSVHAALFILQQNMLPFICPQDCSTWEHHLPLFATTAHLLSAIYLDKPVPSYILRRKTQDTVY